MMHDTIVAFVALFIIGVGFVMIVLGSHDMDNRIDSLEERLDQVPTYADSCEVVTTFLTPKGEQGMVLLCPNGQH